MAGQFPQSDYPVIPNVSTGSAPGFFETHDFNEATGKWELKNEFSPGGGSGGGVPPGLGGGGETITVTGAMPPGTYPGIPIPMPPPTGPPTNLPQEPLAGEVPDPRPGIPPWFLPGALLNGIDVLNPFTDVPTGVPKEGGIPDWLEKLLKGLLLAGALAPGGGGGGGGGTTVHGGGVTGGGAGGGAPGLGTLKYGGMKGGGNFQPWNPGAGQQMLRGGSDPGAVGSMMSQLFGVGR